MSRYVKSTTETRKLVDELVSLRNQHVRNKEITEANTAELAKINERAKVAKEKEINDREKEVRRSMEKVNWIRYDNDVYAVKKHHILNKLDIL